MASVPPALTRLHTVIIGGGLAGVTAASKLLASGIRDIVVLEASHRLGGRICDLHLSTGGDDDGISGGEPVCVGATWLHSSIGNPLYDFAAAAGLLDAGRAGTGRDGTSSAMSRASGGDGTAVAASEPEAFSDAWYDPTATNPVLFLRPGGVAVARRHIISAFRVVMDALDEGNRAARAAGEGAASATASPAAISTRQYLTPAWHARVEGAMAAAGVHADAVPLLRPLYDSLFEFRNRGECAYTGAPNTSHISMTAQSAYFEGDCVNTPPPRGLQSIFDAIAAPVRAAGVAATTKRVVSIQWDSGDGGGGVVTCSDGSRYVATHAIIVTVSLGVLQHWVRTHAVLDPPLPPRHMAAIQALGFGRVEKVHAVYDTFWWRGLASSLEPLGPGQHCGGLAFLHDAAEAAACGDDTTPTHHGAYSGYWPGWLSELFGCYEDRDPIIPSRPILTWWFMRDSGLATDSLTTEADGVDQEVYADEDCAGMEEGEEGPGPTTPPPSQPPAARIVQAMTAVLRRFLMRRASGSGGEGAEAEVEGGGGGWAVPLMTAIPRPRRLIRSRWGAHPLYRGSYTYMPPGSSVGDMEVLARPLRKEGGGVTLLFAGEATHANYFSTTHAAYTTGLRAAEMAATAAGV